MATGTVSDIERDLRHLRRADIGHTVAVVALLVASVALLAVGLARLSAITWFGGAVALLAAFVVDEAIQRWRDRELNALLAEA